MKVTISAPAREHEMIEAPRVEKVGIWGIIGAETRLEVESVDELTWRRQGSRLRLRKLGSLVAVEKRLDPC